MRNRDLDLPVSSSTGVTPFPKRAGKVQAWGTAGIVQMLVQKLLCGLDINIL